MRVLLYNQLDTVGIPNFAKMKSLLEAGDFRSAEVKKVGDNLYRARLNRSDRLLFCFGRHGGRTCILVLEHIARHAYEKSRFLNRGVTVDESKLPPLEGDAPVEAIELAYINPVRPAFNVLDKIISFDEEQGDVFALPPPMVVVGSAGSGKTVLTLEKMKEAEGNVLYVTRSSHLVDNSRALYYGMNYENDKQEVSFLSFREFLESIRVPKTREVGFVDFARWFARHRVASGLKDPYQLFEEINGVIAGSSARGCLSKSEYLALGVRQSIYSREERAKVYDLFVKYLAHIAESGSHDVNVLSHEYQELVTPTWDFVVVDEVQDFTNVQLDLVMRSLKDQRRFILCGDANQIVHPNFFSWTGIKRYFHGRDDVDEPVDLLRILTTNYRNSLQVTETANRILRLKHARFGSVDRESNFLVSSNSDAAGTVTLLANEADAIRELDHKTRQSTRFAVIVMHDGQKAAAKKQFHTPLIFSIQEAKGLEYDNIILYDFASGDEARFREIVRDVAPESLSDGELRYARARDKSDKSLEIFKFHINALYVAVTRAIANVYLVESKPRQRLFDLLGIEVLKARLDLAQQQSSLAEWQREALVLERQGKTEQAEEIRSRILGIQPISWQPLTGQRLEALSGGATNGRAVVNKKKALQLFIYALLSHDESRIARLAYAGFRAAKRAPQHLQTLAQHHFMPYSMKRADHVRKLVERYGVDYRDAFNFTPLMLAARFGNLDVAAMLMEMGANPELVNSAGLNAFQIMLQEATVDERYAKRAAPGLHRLLAPASTTVMVDNRLLKLDSHKVEFLFVQLMVALFHTRLPFNVMCWQPGFKAADLAELLSLLPRSAVPERLTKRAYISGVLARNEVDRDYAYNRRIFRRTSHGVYILNPRMSFRISDEWFPVYKLLDPQAFFNFDAHDERIVRLLGKDFVLREHEEARRRFLALIAGGSSTSNQQLALFDTDDLSAQTTSGR
ncbi:MAG: hypothetical protein OXU70_14825 [Gammaproteobacteria bacterium]|nr:hypothetical protein [Gammaproteobacteria bacterium]